MCSETRLYFMFCEVRMNRGEVSGHSMEERAAHGVRVSPVVGGVSGCGAPRPGPPPVPSRKTSAGTMARGKSEARMRQVFD